MNKAEKSRKKAELINSRKFYKLPLDAKFFIRERVMDLSPNQLENMIDRLARTTRDEE